jgi:hypothetical protein
MVKYMTEYVPVEQTINNCNELIKFQKIVRISGKYEFGWHNNKKLVDKTFRVFASQNLKDSYIGKQKAEGTTVEKFANTPEHCFIDNTNILNKSVPAHLDKSWYITLAKKRLNDFGVM